MKEATRIKLMEAQRYCDENRKSTEFMIQYMQDSAGVEFDTVIRFLKENWREDVKIISDVPSVKLINLVRQIRARNKVAGTRESPTGATQNVKTWNHTEAEAANMILDFFEGMEK